ncbi:hypothetical protein [Alloactinosynnema sp. L-07]|uniref:hypothetical protein n=1 Tax=Alloactinosynnema sp. L-07 TaxID=1653480 RepID=UPI0006B56810|nr:hypothetical protein [Alloactinosynnema sp. L-07]
MIRPGTPADADTLLAFFDDAVAWMVTRGQSGQWGSEPLSTVPAKVDRVRGMAESPGLWISEVDGQGVSCGSWWVVSVIRLVPGRAAGTVAYWLSVAVPAARPGAKRARIAPAMIRRTCPSLRAP